MRRPAIESLCDRRLLTSCAPPHSQLPQTATVSDVETAVAKSVASARQTSGDAIQHEQFSSKTELIDRLMTLAQRQYQSILGQTISGSDYAAHLATIHDCGWYPSERSFHREIVSINRWNHVEPIGKIESIGTSNGVSSRSLVVGDHLVLINPIAPIGITRVPNERSTQARVRIEVYDPSDELRLLQTHTIDGFFSDAQVHGDQLVLTQFDNISFPYPKLISDAAPNQPLEIEATTVTGQFESSEQYSLRIRETLVDRVLPDYEFQIEDGTVVEGELGNWRDVSVISTGAQRTSVTTLDFSNTSTTVADLELMWGGLLRVRDRDDDQLLLSRVRSPAYPEQHVDLALLSIDDTAGNVSVQAVGSLAGSIDSEAIGISGNSIHLFVDRTSAESTRQSLVKQIDFHVLEPIDGQLTTVGSILDMLPNRESTRQIPVAFAVNDDEIVAALDWLSPRLLRIDITDASRPRITHSSNLGERREFTNVAHLSGSLFATLSRGSTWSIDVYQLDDEGDIDLVTEHETTATLSSLPGSTTLKSETLLWFADHQILAANIPDRTKDSFQLLQFDLEDADKLEPISVFDRDHERAEAVEVNGERITIRSHKEIEIIDLDSPTASVVIDQRDIKTILVPAELEETTSEIPSSNAADVNQDKIVSALDALLVINVLNLMSPDQPNDMASLHRQFPEREYLGRVDVDGNGMLTALDALRVVNVINASANTATLRITASGEQPREDDEPVDSLTLLDDAHLF